MCMPFLRITAPHSWRCSRLSVCATVGDSNHQKHKTIADVEKHAAKQSAVIDVLSEKAKQGAHEAAPAVQKGVKKVKTVIIFNLIIIIMWPFLYLTCCWRANCPSLCAWLQLGEEDGHQYTRVRRQTRTACLSDSGYGYGGKRHDTRTHRKSAAGAGEVQAA